MNTSSKSSPRSHILPYFVTILVLLLVIAATVTALTLHLTAQAPSQTETAAPLDIPGDTPPYHFDYSWSDQSPYIAHALGGILGDSYTNSHEAFLLNYQLGQRLFEVDLLSLDGTIIAAHTQPAADYLSALTKGKYHPLTFATIAQLLSEHPDVYLLTDTKYTDPATVTAEFSSIIATAKSIDVSILDRLVIQIYNQPMLATVMELYPWKSVIYTLYNDPTWTPENVLDFATKSGVKYITMWEDLVTPEIVQLWQPAGIKIGAHTVNDLTTADRLLSLGVSNIYTDFLLP